MQDHRSATPLGSPLAAIEGLYSRALVAGGDFEVHDQFAYALINLAAQWDEIIGRHEGANDETQATVWDSAWQAACHPFVVTFGDGWTELISVPTLTMAWKQAEKSALAYGCNIRTVACTRRCWYCLVAEADYDRAARDVIGARVAEQMGRAVEATRVDGLRAVVRVTHDGKPRLSDSSVQPSRPADPSSNGRRQG